jgi:hypothetical protein
MQGIADLPFVQNTSLTFGDLEGRFNLVTRRADLILGSIPEDATHVELHFRQGPKGRILDVYLDGAKLTGTDAMESSLHRMRYQIPKDQVRSGFHRITVRTDLPSWMESFDRAPSDLYLHQVAFETNH